MQMKHPPPLSPGAEVAVTCPASPVNEDELERGVAHLRSLDLDVRVGLSCSAAPGLWAGEDRSRADELAGFLLDRSIEAVFAARGGVGCMRLLPFLEDLPEDLPPKWIVGRSDITALHLAFLKRYGWIGLSGPMVATDFGHDRGERDEITKKAMRLLRDPASSGTVNAPAIKVWKEGTAEGRLIPANLSLLASMVGTPYLPNLDDTIVVIEDIDEPPRRIDRMLTQLRLAGLFDHLNGLVLGQFTSCEPNDTSTPAGTLEKVLRDHTEGIGVPTLSGLPYGHEPLFEPLPLGTRARIESDPPSLILLEGASKKG